MSLCAEETKYPYILDAVAQYKQSYSDTNALQVIFETARSDDHEAVVTHCMAIYTLHMGKENRASVCQGGYKAILTRYPDSDIARQMRALSLFPDPCPTCKGLGVVQKQSVSACSSCLNSGQCNKCGGTGRVRHGGVGLRGPVPRGNHIQSSITFYNPGGNVIYRSRQRNYARASSAPSAIPQITIPCSNCRGTGRCPVCYGEPKKARMVNVRCPSCNGVAKGISTAVAESALATVCENTAKLLNMAIDCENSFLEICEMTDLFKQQEMLADAIKRHEKAFNLDLLFGLKDEVDKQAAGLRKEAEAAAQKKITEHKALFEKIRALSDKQIALEEINAFLAGKPESPLKKDFELHAKELHQKLLKNKKTPRENASC